jgi:hypothetical protein
MMMMMMYPEGGRHLVANTVKFAPINPLYTLFTIEYANTLIEETISTKFLGLKIDNHLNWKKKIFPN